MVAPENFMSIWTMFENNSAIMASLDCRASMNKTKILHFSDNIYVKTTIFEHDILSSAWKSNEFPPSLSTRWNTENSTIIIPIVNESSLNNISIKVSQWRISLSF